nr:histone deacetylase 14 [Tanacetum cinerariifolium]
GKQNLSRHTTGKKRATLIVIPSIRFTRLIIHHLQRRHKFHPRLDSLLHLPNDEPVLGYLKFSAKGTKREVFRMPIPGSLITADIREASYYQEYQANVAKHRRFLAGETESAQASPAPKLAKPARKPKSTTHKAPPRPSVSTSVTSAQPAPTSAPAKPDVSKIHKPISSLKSVAASEAEEVPVVEPQVADEDADYQKDLEESMKTAYAFPWGKGKAKVSEEQVAHDLLSLQKAKKKSLVEQYIFQRHTFTTTRSSGQNEPSYAKLERSERETTEKVIPEADKVGQGKSEGHAGPDPGAQPEGQMGSDAGAQDETSEGQAGSNPDETSEGEAGPDPGNVGGEMQSIPSHEQLDEGFTATVYPKVQENLKLTVEEQGLLEDPASSSGTLSSLQHLSKDIIFGDLFSRDKPSKADNNKSTTKIKVESMVSVTIQQDMSTLPPSMWTIPPMTSPIVDLTSRPESPKGQQQFKATTTETTTTTTTTTTTLPPPTAQQQSTTEAMMMKRIGELEHLMADLIKVNKEIEERLDTHGAHLPKADMKEILHQRMWETESHKSHEDHMQLLEALEKSMNPEAHKRKKKSHESPKTPPGSPPHQPPPPPPAGPSGAFGLSQAWTTTDTRLRPSISLTPADLEMDEDMGPDEQEQLSDDEDIKIAHIPKVNLRQDLWKPLEEERSATPEHAWSIPSSNAPVLPNNWASALARGITEHKPQDLEGPAFEIVKVFHPDVVHLQYQMEECHKLLTDSVDDPILRHNVTKPLPLGGPPGQVSIQSGLFFNKYLEYLRYGSKGSRPTLSISKMKAAYYPDTGLEQMVPDQLWIEEDCKYDIAAMYGISHGWFQRQRFYIDRHTSEGNRGAVRTHMRILSVVRIEVFSLYGYDYMKKIVLRRHLNHLPPKDKKILTTGVNQWTRHLVIRQRIEDFQLGIESYQTQLNLTKPQWDSTGFEYKHDYTVINSPRAVIFWDKYGVQMMMRFNEIHKFKYKVLDQEGRGSEQGVHVRYSEALEDTEDLPQLGELFEIEKVAVYSSLRSLKPKRTIESRAKRSSKIISLGHYSIILASSHTVKSKTDIKSPTHYPCGIAKTSECYVSSHTEDRNPARANIKQALGR